jgi:hypothetical protein
MNAWWKALESGFRAGLKQYRRMRSMQRKAAIPDPLTEEA